MYMCSGCTYVTTVMSMYSYVLKGGAHYKQNFSLSIVAM